jgi:hypothetical protein
MNFGRKLLIGFVAWVAVSIGISYPNVVIGGSMTGYGLIAVIIIGVIHRIRRGRWN